MNILIIEDMASSTFGGAERTLRSYCEHLATHHHLHLVYDRGGDYSRDLAHIYATVTRISVHPLRAQPLRSWLREIYKLMHLCKRQKIDLILTHVVHSVLMLRVVRMFTGIRVVVLFKWVCSTERVGLQAEWGLKGVDRGISVSHFVAGYWTRNGFPPNRMCVIPEGVAVDLGGSGAECRRLSRVNGNINVGFAGRIVPEKGLHVLIDAIALLRKQGIGAECFVAGTFEPGDDNLLQSYHASVQKQIDDLDMKSTVHFVGYINPLSDFIKRRDVMVLPSLCQDAQPIVVMESMAAGTPVVATRVGGVPEMLTGALARWICRPGDVMDLCTKLAEFLALTDAEKAQLACVLRDHVVTNYSIQTWHQRMSKAIGLQCRGTLEDNKKKEDSHAG
jgi:glycosyltransferase involved in cell wall biosynthesis